MTVATLKEYGGTVKGGHFAVATKPYFDFLVQHRKTKSEEIKKGF
jgi:hypothetical protein